MKRMNDALFTQLQAEMKARLEVAWASPPAELYHYTSGAGLHGILESNALWGGNYAFMNDRSEFAYALDLLYGIIGERLQSTRTEHTRAILERALHPHLWRALTST
jgi:hypothetical protein